MFPFFLPFFLYFLLLGCWVLLQQYIRGNGVRVSRPERYAACGGVRHPDDGTRLTPNCSIQRTPRALKGGVCVGLWRQETRQVFLFYPLICNNLDPRHAGVDFVFPLFFFVRRSHAGLPPFTSDVRHLGCSHVHFT